MSALDDVSPESSHRALVQALRDLGIALAVFPDVLPEEEAAFVSPWRRAAAEAIAGVSRGDTLAFQAGAVQDGFRATLAAFMAVSQADAACR